MHQFQTEQLQLFLRAVDGNLRQPFELLLIGGSAAALAYNVLRTTGDIDTWRNIPPNIALAFELARQ